MKINIKITIVLILVILSVQITKAQSNDNNLTEILEKIEAQAKKYSETFKNLVAEESKISRTYEKGNIEKERTIKSTLVIYESADDSQSSATEYRNILSVDGNPVKDSEKRVEKIFKKATNSKSIEKELKTLKDESYRYDKTLKMDGFVFSNAIFIKQQYHPYFEFKLEGIENLNGEEVYVISYQQFKTSEKFKSDIKVARKDAETLDLIFENDKPLVFYKGKVFVDKKTFQIWREESNTYLPRNNGKEDFEFIKSVFEYQPSQFGILVPRKILHSNFNPKYADSQIKFVKSSELILEYSKFWKPESEIKSADLK